MHVSQVPSASNSSGSAAAGYIASQGSLLPAPPAVLAASPALARLSSASACTSCSRVTAPRSSSADTTSPSVTSPTAGLATAAVAAATAASTSAAGAGSGGGSSPASCNHNEQAPGIQVVGLPPAASRRQAGLSASRRVGLAAGAHLCLRHRRLVLLPLRCQRCLGLCLGRLGSGRLGGLPGGLGVGARLVAQLRLHLQVAPAPLESRRPLHWPACSPRCSASGRHAAIQHLSRSSSA
jgi:hypothetical protein